MAEGAIQRDDIIKSDVLKVFPELAEQIKLVNDQVTVLLNNLRKLGGEISASKSTSELSKNTEQLTTQEKELIKIQNQVSVAIARSDGEYISYKKGLDAVNQSTKEKINLDGQDAKTVNAKTSSLKTLDAALAKNRKSYADLKGEQERTSVAGKGLLKTIQDQDKASKAISDSMGQAQKHVGAYAEALEGVALVGEKLEVNAGGLISNVKELGGAFLKLATNPAFLVLAAAVVVFKVLKESITAFFETTEDGEIIGERLSKTYEAFFFAFKRGMAEIGKAIFDFNKEGKEGGGLVTALGNIVPVFALIKLAAEKTGLTNYFEKLKKQAEEVADAFHEVNEKIIKDIVVKARAELEADKLTLDSKDKINFKDVERLDFAKRAFEIRKQQSSIEASIAKDQLEATFKQIALEKGQSEDRIKLAVKDEKTQKEVQLTADQKKRIAEAEANILNKQNDSLQLQRRLVGEISTIQLEITKNAIDRERAKISSSQDLTLSELQAQLKINEEKIKNNLSTQDEITRAIYDASLNREAIAVAEFDKEVSDAKHAAEDRVRSTGETNDEIIEDTIRKDDILKKQLIASEVKFRATTDAIDKQLIQDLNENTARGLQKKFDDLVNGIKTEANDRINSLEKEFLSGSIKNLSSYENEIKRIKDESNRNVLIATVKFTKNELGTLMLSGEQKIKLQETISALELAITQTDADKKLILEKKTNELLLQLQNQFFASAQQLVQDSTQKQIDSLDKETKVFEDAQQTKLDAVKRLSENQIAIAGDDAQLKLDAQKRAQQEEDKINQQTVIREKQIQDKRNQLLRRQAIFEKALAITQAGINTAEQATKVLDFPPLVALVLALGALQIATIAAKPIPQFYKGGTMKETGAALVGEQGMELMRTPKGDIKATPNKATLVNLEKGTKVWNHSESMRMIALAGLNGRNTIENYQGQTLNNEILDQLTKVNDTLLHQPSSDYLYSNVYHVIQVTKRNDNLTLHRRAKLFGIWGK